MTYKTYLEYEEDYLPVVTFVCAAVFDFATVPAGCWSVVYLFVAGYCLASDLTVLHLTVVY